MSFDEEESDGFDCTACSGTGQEYEGDLLVGDCTHCDGTGLDE